MMIALARTHMINSQKVAFPYPPLQKKKSVCTDRMSVNGQKRVFSSEGQLNFLKNIYIKFHILCLLGFVCESV